ncbi:glycosyltransferase family 61 protein [Singulisphaera sp. Ch08]|uniref:Glycosyltransferase family 61 protein n=1 Tax=Singulisphaera sp. Ch08 TaxID=3120278 RepID=A0AAU7CQ30_9BACT
MTRLLSLLRFADRALLTQAARAAGRVIRGRIRHVLVPPLSRAFKSPYLANSALHATPERYGVVEYGCGETITVPRPPDSGELPGSFVKRVGTWNLSRPWYALIADARLLGPTALAYTAENAIVGESIIPENYAVRGAPVTTRSVCLSALPPSWFPRVDEACSMVGPWSQSYFEWLVEFLPRLRAVEHFRECTGRRLKIIIDAKPTPWQWESLQLLGFTPDDLIVWNGRAARVGLLLVPSFPRRLCEPGRAISLVSPEALRWTRDSILSKLPPASEDGPRRVLISRRKAPGRRVVNEDEVMGLLSRFGFVSRVLEDLSFTEQVRLFAKARCVVAPHGAGLANMTFSRELRVVELYGSYVNPSFFTLAASLNFRYGCLRCESIRSIHPKRDDLKIDIIKLERLLGEIEAGCRSQLLQASGERRDHEAIFGPG